MAVLPVTTATVSTAPTAMHVEPVYRAPTNKKGPAQDMNAGAGLVYAIGKPAQGLHPAAVSKDVGTFHNTPIMALEGTEEG